MNFFKKKEKKKINFVVLCVLLFLAGLMINVSIEVVGSILGILCIYLIFKFI